MKGILFVAAEKVIQSTDTNQISVINILEDLVTESYPFVIQYLNLVCYIEKEKSDEDEPISKLIIMNNEKEIVNTSAKVFLKNIEKTRLIINLNGIPFYEPGDVKFTLYDKINKEIASYKIKTSLREKIKVTSINEPKK
jgi:hypothetical protein